ncbi:MAG: hypothetical protein O7D94_05000 [Planctomycetota bacterium]|nr:hypothetical protein [Planctomycetota bacterium]MCZ6698271.1 hypothetical protein [Planctomycetota bacterium]
MKTASEYACEVESEYMAGVRANLAEAGGTLLGGSRFEREEHDSAEAVRAAMVDRRIYDRERYGRMPHGYGFTMRGLDRRWLFGKRVKSVTIASVLAPPGPLLETDEPAPPVTMSELMRHVESLKTKNKAPHLIGVCSPGGFEEEVWNSPPQISGVRLVLIEPREDGGWRISKGLGTHDAKLCKLFDPEQIGQKIGRVRQELEERSTDLLTGSVSARSVAERLDLPQSVVEQAFDVVEKADPELRVSKRSGEMMLFRGAPVASGREDGSMSLSEWVKSLFSKEGEEATKINVLSERRASLSGRLDRLYTDISKLEKKEGQLRDEGKATKVGVAKRRIAGQISRLRKDISRVNTSASILSKQINVISTHIHNLELAQTGTVAQLPTGEELTEAAVNAEQILEDLSASDDLVSSLEVNMAETSISDDEAAILRELEGEPSEGSGSAKASSSEAAPRETESGRRERGQAQAE